MNMYSKVTKHKVLLSYIFSGLMLFLALLSIGYFSAYLPNVRSDVIKRELWVAKQSDNLKYLSIKTHSSVDIIKSNDWIDLSSELENQGDLEFSISKIFNLSNNNEFRITDESDEINKYVFSVLDTDSYKKDPNYSTMHILLSESNNGWSAINENNNSIFITKMFAQALLVSRGQNNNAYTSLIGTELNIITPNSTNETFVISGITFVNPLSSSTNGYIYNQFQEDVFFISHRKASEYQSGSIFAFFRTNNKKNFYRYYDSLQKIYEINKSQYSYSVSRLNEINSDFDKIEGNTIYQIIVFFVYSSSFVLIALATRKYMRTLLEEHKRKVSISVQFNLVIFSLVLLCLSAFAIMILKSVKFLVYSFTSLNSSSMNIISVITLVLIFINITYITNITTSVKEEHIISDEFEKFVKFYTTRENNKLR